MFISNAIISLQSLNQFMTISPKLNMFFFFNFHPRSNSLKSDLNSKPDVTDSSLDDDVFVTASPMTHNGLHQVKSAMIVSSNPYCTTARVRKQRHHKDKDNYSPNLSEEEMHNTSSLIGLVLIKRKVSCLF